MLYTQMRQLNYIYDGVIIQILSEIIVKIKWLISSQMKLSEQDWHIKVPGLCLESLTTA